MEIAESHERRRAEVTFVSVSPSRLYMSPAGSRLQLHHSVDKDRWEGVSPETVGRPQGLRPRRIAPSDFASAQEQRFRQQLDELTQGTDPRPPLLRFLPVKESQLLSESVQTHTYSKGNFLQPHSLLYRAYHSDSRLVRSILELAGFSPTDSHDWNVLWLSSSPLEYLYKGLNEYQRISHFPRTSEITRKDRFCASIARMKSLHNAKSYSFVPETYVLPQQKAEFQLAYEEKKCAWISKPCASSQGRGIALIDSTGASLPTEPCVVSKYIANPLLLNGLKFDLRLYVLVTCFCPLRIYVFEEGLARFACESYDSVDASKSKFMHLTNYSVNKKSELFQQNQDVRQDNTGHKWSLSALCKHLESIGADVPLLWARIYSLIIKTVLAIEDDSVAATERLGLHRCNCFDLLGFDVLLDSSYKPWLLEVNLSPSLGVDSPLDLHIKGNLVSDMFTLIGIRGFNRKLADASKIRSRLRAHKKVPLCDMKSLYQCKEMLRETLEEYERRGHFIRIYPAYRCDAYDSLFTSLRMENKWVYAVLFQGQSALLTHISERSGEVTALSMSMLEGAEAKEVCGRRQRRNLSSAAQSPMLPSLCPRKASQPPSDRVLLTDVLIEYLARISEIVKETSDSVSKPLWKQRLESFAERMKWSDWTCEENAVLSLRIARRVTEMLRRRDLESLYGKAKTREESRSEESARKRLKLASPVELERILRAADAKARAVESLFDKRNRGVLLNLLQSGKEQPRSQSCLDTDQGEEEDRDSTKMKKS